MINTILIIVFLVILAAIAMLCRSLVHKLWHNYSGVKTKLEKLFRTKISDKWWDPRLSWQNKHDVKWTIDVFGFRWITKVMVQFSDAFHTFNTIELGCYDGIISTLITIIFYLLFGLTFWYLLLIFISVYLLIGVVIFVFFFNLGYDELYTK